eukprot:COSAG02_NODE_7322_length_3063_cov_1.736167_2_plen_231_part_00
MSRGIARIAPRAAGLVARLAFDAARRAAVLARWTARGMRNSRDGPRSAGLWRARQRSACPRAVLAAGIAPTAACVVPCRACGGAFVAEAFAALAGRPGRVLSRRCRCAARVGTGATFGRRPSRRAAALGAPPAIVTLAMPITVSRRAGRRRRRRRRWRRLRLSAEAAEQQQQEGQPAAAHDPDPPAPPPQHRAMQCSPPGVLCCAVLCCAAARIPARVCVSVGECGMALC